MNILKKPLVTEKVSKLNDRGIYGFFVAINANKVEIKKEVESLYGVSVEKVNTIRCAGKRKVRYTRKRVMKGKMPNYKKALVYLKKGDVIDFYSDI